MSSVNYGSKYDHRLTLRLNEEQYQFIIQISKMLDVSPSDYLRMAVNAGMVSIKAQNADFSKILKEGQVGMSNENIKTDSDDIV